MILMNINRDYLIILDVKSGEVDSPNIYYFNTDKNTSNLYVQMVLRETTVEASPIDNATNYSIKANILKPNMVGKIVEGDLVNEEKAIYEFKLPADCTDFSGNAKIEFEVYCTVDGVEEIVTSFATKFKVYGSVLTEQNKYIEDSSDYPILKQLIEEVKELQANGGGGTGGTGSGHTHSNKTVLDGITAIKINSWDTAYTHSQSTHFNGNYNNLTDKPIIPTNTSQLINDSGFITEGSIDFNFIDDTTTATNKTWSSSKIDSQIKDMAKKTSVENGILYLLKSDGTKIDTGTEIPIANVTDEQLTTIINRLIADGTLAALTIEDESITYAKLSNDVKDKIENSTNSFSSWLAIGDSITVGYGNSNYSYADIIAKKYGVYMVKDAVTGSNIASDQDNFGAGFVNRVDNNDADYNLITVMGGLNDFSHATVSIGTFNADIAITDTISSFYDGVTILCKKLITKYPNSKIVFLSSNRDNTYNNKNGESYEQFMEAIDTVCSYFSIPFYRIDDLCGFNRDVYKNQGIDNGDMNTNDIHPKTLGHRKIAGAICDCINFVNPMDSWGKGTLNITQLSSTIASDATTSDIKKALTVKITYNNGVEFEITNYSIEGYITEGASTFTISYRGITATTTFTTGGASGTGITPSFQLASPISVDSTTKKVDIGVNPYSEAKAITIKCKFNVTLNNNAVGVPLLRCHGTNPNTILGMGVNAVGLSTNRVAVVFGGSSTVIYNSSNTSDYLEFGVDTELFLVWDGATTITVYNVDASGIKWSKTITNVTINTGEGSFYFGNDNTTRYYIGTLTTFNVYDVAFTEQDVLNNI